MSRGAIAGLVAAAAAHAAYVSMTCPPCTAAERDYYYAMVVPGSSLPRRQASREKVRPWRRQAIVRYADMQPERARRYRMA